VPELLFDEIFPIAFAEGRKLATKGKIASLD
jgi:hypothetical protein